MFSLKDRLTKLKGSWTSPNLSQTATTNEMSNPFGSGTDDGPLPVYLNGVKDTTKHRLLTPEMCDEIRSLMPTRIQLYTDWRLVYSLEQHGASLRSLYDNIAPDGKQSARVGYVLVVEDKKGGIFGAYTNEHFRPTDNRRYYGNGECFLWKLEKVPTLYIGDTKADDGAEADRSHRWSFKGFPFTGLNEFVIYCTSKFLSMGAGDGHYGLWIDSGLLNGVSNPSLTFGNETLSREGDKFHVVGLEVWRVG
ncbi:LAMI_0D08812g1_1 [Lachancea mirantina]|uniref:Oxidation resistance protein 1 n=1 Tax=Lachancea mirantina TaxID=1230905 RepID=A0A1G4JD62_9SACH|nr:LAMI_0D08812g1_1 [Lachancea mirantina]